MIKKRLEQISSKYEGIWSNLSKPKLNKRGSSSVSELINVEESYSEHKRMIIIKWLSQFCML